MSNRTDKPIQVSIRTSYTPTETKGGAFRSPRVQGPPVAAAAVAPGAASEEEHRLEIRSPVRRIQVSCKLADIYIIYIYIHTHTYKPCSVVELSRGAEAASAFCRTGAIRPQASCTEVLGVAVKVEGRPG